MIGIGKAPNALHGPIAAATVAVADALLVHDAVVVASDLVG
jgi:hypothetical protein